jgi:hypothetical protein
MTRRDQASRTECLGSPQAMGQKAPFPWWQLASTAGQRSRAMLTFEGDAQQSAVRFARDQAGSSTASLPSGKKFIDWSKNYLAP